MIEKCNARNVDSPNRCEKPANHTGPHACYVLGGKVTWAHLYDKMKITRVEL